MPRDAIAITDVPVASAVTTPAGTTISVANGAAIAVGATHRLIVRVTNTFAGAKNVTFKAGANPPALRASLGDLVVSIPASTGDKLIVLETARHLQADGTISVDFEAGMTGAVAALRAPKGA